MIEKIGHIKNPLTVIAIFAGIAEISGTVVLPFVSPEIQKTYIWFLMLFPSFLVGVFFYTLHRNPASLYSPSDYQNEDNFLKSVRRTTAEEIATKLQLEVIEVESDIKKELPEKKDNPNTEEQPSKTVHASENAQPYEIKRPETTQDQGNTSAVKKVSPSLKESIWNNAEPDSEVVIPNTDLRTRVITDVAAAEKLAITRLSRELGITFQSDVHFALDAYNNRSFNAFANVGRQIHFVEVKFFATSSIDVSRFYDAINFAHQAVSHFKRGERDVVLHLFIVADANKKSLVEAEYTLRGYARTLNVPVKIYSAHMKDLANEYQYG